MERIALNLKLKTGRLAQLKLKLVRQESVWKLRTA
jgi:hypothetical protein